MPEYAIDYLPPAIPLLAGMRLAYAPRTAPMVRQPGWFKKSQCGWRRNTAEWAPSADAKARSLRKRELAYLKWLVTTRELGEVCSSCGGKGRQSTGSIWGGEEFCGACGGNGGPGIVAAHDYCNQQHYALQEKAAQAINGLRHRLFWHGLRPVVRGAALATLADYDRLEEDRERARAAFEEAAEAHRAIENETRCLMPAEIGGEDWDQWYDRVSAPRREAERRMNEARDALWQFGDLDESRWAFPGSAEQIYVGTEKPRRHYGYVKPDVAVVIESGCAPDSYELDRIAEDAIAALSGGQDLLAAAA